MYRENGTEKFSLSQVPKRKILAAAAGITVLIVFAFAYLKINPVTAIVSVPEFISFFARNFLPPDFKNTMSYLPLIIETIMFAVVGTYISAALAFIFGLLLCEKTNSIAWLRFAVRFIISFLRNVPVLVWASLFVYIFGIGNMVGLIALVVATLGFLSRSYAESMNEIAGRELEALKACGGSYLQILFHGLIPEFIPSWLNWTLFSLEINIRASAILGMVGAGGIGIMIQTNIRLFKYHEALSLIIILVAMVLLTEFGTNKLRKLIR
ncbi:MAG: phosphonate ABC transporter, permease protein PhnE [Oscillospiraceae bacterium]|jgi:phosphonate transport system permease protein|nr:phosphonate ABC transporter, permease protein PhnE [Oscillospiraceae bacterium]